MRPGSLLLDFSPGSAVDHEALSAALTAGHLAGAAIDVPPSAESESEFRSELRGLPNVILTPHTGAFTEESEEDAVRFVSAKLHDFLAGGAGREAAPGRRPGYPRRR
jgi:D-3-phosphoglycerate dehydrogenase